MSKDKQFGFGRVMVIVAVLVLVGLGYVGYRVYGHFNKPSTTNNTTANQTTGNQSTGTQTDPNAGYVVIKEWGVRFKPVNGLSGVTYSITSSQRPNAIEAMLMTDQLKATNIPTCNGTQANSRPLGAIVRITTAEDLSQHLNNDQLLGQVDGYYYYYYEPTQQCDPSPNFSSTNTLQSDTLSKIKTSLASIEAAK
jgi:hypothetical protein